MKKRGHTPKKRERSVPVLSKGKKIRTPLDIHDMTPEEKLKFEIAEELGLGDQVLRDGWRSLTSKESGRIGGLITKRKRELKKQEETSK